MATYHGITKAECLKCGYATEDDVQMELWNDYGATCMAETHETGVTRWTLADGTVRVVIQDEQGDIETYDRLDPAREAALAHFEEVWSDGMLHEHIGEKLTCTEVEALAGVLRVLGGEGVEETVDYLTQAHAYGDDEGDLHYEDGESS